MVNHELFSLLQKQTEMLMKTSKSIEIPGYEKRIYSPFFVSMGAHTSDDYCIDVRNGNVIQYATPNKNPYLVRMEIRMGDPKLGGSVAHDTFAIGKKVPKKPTKEFVHCANELFWECAEELEEMYSNTIGSKRSRHDYFYFSDEKPVNFIEQENQFDVDFESYAEDLEIICKKLMKPWTRDVFIEFNASNHSRHYVNSEGSLIYCNQPYCELLIDVYSTDKDLQLLNHAKVLRARTKGELPSLDEVLKEGERLVNDIKDMRKAPIEGSGYRPVIFDGYSSDILFHEALGHGIEGDGLQDCDESANNLFRRSKGKRIMPSFISIYDDPKLQSFNGEYLNGHYIFDDEGVKAKKVNIIKDGVLKGFLHSRQSAGFARRKSNGHCRFDVTCDSGVRMGNIIVNSSNAVPFEELKKSMMKICEEKDMKYGILVKESMGGWVMPTESIFNSFPANTFRLYTDGRIQRVRGIKLVGSPHIMLDSIVQTSDNYQIFNGNCGDVSGWVRNAGVAPDVLVNLMEVNETDEEDEVRIPVI